MQESYEREYLEAEKTHPWFVKRRELIYQLIENLPKDSKILDFGCGSGITLQYLRQKGFTKLHGYEPSAGMRKNDTLKVFSKKPDEKYDVVLLLDVLEHIKDEEKAITDISDLLRPNGLLVMTVPAFNALWSHHDVLNKHYRRYDKKMIWDVSKNTKLNIKRITYWNMFLFFPVAAVKIFKKYWNAESKSDLSTRGIVNKAMSKVLSFENKAIQRNYNLPFGTSLVALLNKEDEG